MNINSSNYTGRVWQFNEDELFALDYLPHIDRVLYMFGIRTHMDFSTGMTGIRRRVSYQSFKELLEVNRAKGSNKGSYSPTKDELRASIARLVRVGLIERINLNTGEKVEPLVFKLPIAHVGAYSSRNNEPQQNPTGAPPQKNPAAARVGDGMNPTEENTMNPIHQLDSYKDIKEYSENSNEFEHSATPDSVNLEKPKAVDQVGRGSMLGPCPHAEILDLWNGALPGKRSPNRNLWAKQTAAAHLRSRWQEAAHIDHSNGKHKLYSDRESGLAWWGRFFTHLSKSRFLMSDEATFFDLAWVVKKANFYKALDGKYNNA